MALSGSPDNEMKHISYANASCHVSRVHGAFFGSFIASVVDIRAAFRPSATGSALPQTSVVLHPSTNEAVRMNQATGGVALRLFSLFWGRV